MSKPDNQPQELAGLAHDRHRMFKFREPASASRDALFNGLLAGTYKKPFLIEEFQYRSMCFTLDGCTQSEMLIDDPYVLVNEYTRKMMGFLAFHPRPEKLMIIGLGGGSLVKYCHRNLPATQITAVEIDSDVLALRSEFCVPPDDERLTVIQADGADHVAQMAQRGEQINALLVDAYDHMGIAAAVVAPRFVENAKRILGRTGVFVMNLVAEPVDARRHLRTIRDVFGESVLVISTQQDGNLVVFAGQALHDPQRLETAVHNAKRAENRLGLFFPTLIQHLKDVADRVGLTG